MKNITKNLIQPFMETKSNKLLDNLSTHIEELSTRVDIVTSKVFDSIKDYFRNIASPSFHRRYLDPTSSAIPEELNHTFYEIGTDIDVAYNEQRIIMKQALVAFNYSQTKKLNVLHHVKQANTLIDSYQLLSDIQYENVVQFTDSFNTVEQIDEGFGTGIKADISTKEGIITLAKLTSENHSVGATISRISGNGELGRMRLLKTANALSDNTHLLIKNMFILEDNKTHSDASVILDNQPHTWFEYQMMNVPAEVMHTYPTHDFRWAIGDKFGDTLRLHLIVQLPKTVSINWLNINPYLPIGYTTGKILVHSLSTSPDGSTYEPIYNSRVILNSQLNVMPDTYDADDISDDFANSKFAGQGVWNFPARQVRFIEVVLDQNESYPTKIGITYYDRLTYAINHLGEQTPVLTRITEAGVPDEIKNSLPGKYPMGKDIYIIKEIVPVDGWRYCIGLRDLNAYSYHFSDRAEIISKKYNTSKAIKAVSLHSHEKIPDAFLDDITTRNSWIRYDISFNDTDWYPISPAHHRQIGEDIIPPKVYLINTRVNPTDEDSRGFIRTTETPNNVRLRITLTRPTDIINASAYTPILEDYTIRLILDGAN